MDSLLLLGTFLLLLVDIVRNVDSNTKLVSEFVYTDTHSTDDPTNILTLDIEVS